MIQLFPNHLKEEQTTKLCIIPQKNNITFQSNLYFFFVTHKYMESKQTKEPSKGILGSCKKLIFGSPTPKEFNAKLEVKLPPPSSKELKRTPKERG